MKEKESKYELPMETNPQNAEIGSKTMDKMLNSMWMASGNAVNENKRAGGSSWKHNLRFVLIALLFLVLGFAFYCAIPYLGIALEWIAAHI